MQNIFRLFLSAGLCTISYGQDLRHVGEIVTSSETDLLLPTSFVTATVAEDLPSALPAEVGMHALRLAVIDEVVDEGLRRAKMPGCVVLVGHQGHVVYHKAFGHRQLVPAKQPMLPDTVFDMASLTKPIATATSVMTLVERGQVDLNAPVAKYIPEFGVNGKEHITVRQLLTHSGGLIPDNEIEDYAEGPAEAFQKIYALGTYVEPGTEFVYTDVGFIVLAEMVHRITGQNIHEYSHERIFAPLGMTATGYLPAESLRARAAVTQERDGQPTRGEVHDPRAWAMGGVSGHAGLFSTATDLARYAQMMINGGSLGDARVLKPETVQQMRSPVQVSSGLRTLGWDMRSPYSSNRGDFFSKSAFGHGGFTGTTLWMDPDQDLFVIFLSNRVHPDGKGSVNALAGRIGTIASGAIELDLPHIIAQPPARKSVILSEHGSKVHAAGLLFDGHNDLPWQMREIGSSSFDVFDIRLDQPQLHTDINRLRKGGVKAQFWSVYVPAKADQTGDALLQTVQQIELVHNMVKRYPDVFEMAANVDDVERIVKSGKIASMMGIEGGYSIESSLANIQRLYDLGCRYMTLTHSKSLEWADSATDDPICGGLSEFGKEVVREMNRVGLLVDLSHVSADCMRDSLSVTLAPVIFSHSSARAINRHPRNVPDDVLRMMPANGGVVMVNFYSKFVIPTDRLEKNDQARGSIHDVVDYIEHIILVAGIDHVGIGSDFDGVPRLPVQLDDVSAYPLITQELLNRGHAPVDIHKLLGGNVLRAMRAAETVAAEMRTQ